MFDCLAGQGKPFRSAAIGGRQSQPSGIERTRQQREMSQAQNAFAPIVPVKRQVEFDPGLGRAKAQRFLDRTLGRFDPGTGQDIAVGVPRDLHSAFSNLVSNAIRYTPGGGRIEIRWQREPDGGARFSVTDTGYGIPAQHIPRLTERFYRVSSSRSRETGGTGLGLSIVKHVLALHQARLEVTSEPGKGSTFACVFEARRALPLGSG